MLALALEAAIRSLILGLVAWAALTCLRVKNPITRLTVWTGLLYVAIAMPLLVVARHALLPALPVLPLPPSVDALIAAPPVLTAPPPIMMSSSAGASPSGAAEPYALWPVVMVTLYGTVALLLLLRLGVGLAQGWALKRRAVTLGGGLYRSGDVSAPVVFGSAIFLPADSASWPDAKRAAVLAHERSHVARGDFYIQLLAAVHRAIFWFNPLGWWLHRELAILAELASDDAAADAHGDRLAYAEILLEVACDARPLAGAVAMARGPEVALRIARLMSGATSSTSLPQLQRLTLGGAGICIVLGALMATPANRTPLAGVVKPGPASLIERVFQPAGDGLRENAGSDEASRFALPPTPRDAQAIAGGPVASQFDGEPQASAGVQPPAPPTPAFAEAPVPPPASQPISAVQSVAPPPPVVAVQAGPEDGARAAVQIATQPLTASARAEAEAKQKKAERARKRAEMAAREVEEYVPLGSHIRGVEAAGGSTEALLKARVVSGDAARSAYNR